MMPGKREKRFRGAQAMTGSMIENRGGQAAEGK